MKKATFLLFLLCAPLCAGAQCAMCRAVLESEQGSTTAQGINNGIVYLMAIPYIILAVVGYIIYKKMKN
jgi:hypothetical protein